MYRLTGLGDTATVQPTVCVPFASWSDPFCLAALIDGEYAPGYTAAVNPSITQAYVAGATPGVVDQSAIDSQTAQATADQIIAGTQASGVSAATAAAAAQAASNAAATPTACIANPSSIACWISTNSTMLIIAACCVGGLFLVKEFR